MLQSFTGKGEAKFTSILYLPALFLGTLGTQHGQNRIAETKQNIWLWRTGENRYFRQQFREGERNVDTPELLLFFFFNSFFHFSSSHFFSWHFSSWPFSSLHFSPLHCGRAVQTHLREPWQQEPYGTLVPKKGEVKTFKPVNFKLEDFKFAIIT